MDRRILVVHPNRLQTARLAAILGRSDRELKLAHDGTDALELLIDGKFALALVALDLPDVSVADLVAEVRQREIPVSVIVLCEHDDQDRAVEALEVGAYDYLTAPFDPICIDHVVEGALADRALRSKVESLEARKRAQSADENYVARGRRMREVLASLRSRGVVHRCMRIVGEPGTGKSRLARVVHHQVWNNPGPFLSVPCGLMADTLLEAELFGRGGGTNRHALGATLAHERVAGATMVLDQVQELSATLQASLAAALCGGAASVSEPRDCRENRALVPARIIALSRIDLAGAAERGTFRRDLLQALGPPAVELPPLRERDPDDLVGLIEHFLTNLCERGCPAKTLAPETLACLMQYPWPGNVRELEDLLEQLVVTTHEVVIDPEQLPPRLAQVRDENGLLHYDIERPLGEIVDMLTERVERMYVRRVLAEYDGRIDRSATHCGISRRALSEKLRRYNIDKDLYKPMRAHRRRGET